MVATRRGRIVYGVHAVRLLLRSGQRVKVVHILPGMKLRAEMESLAAARGARVVLSDRARLDALAGERHHQGVVAEAGNRREYDEKWIAREFAEPPMDTLLLALEGVEDPRNLGACVRTAAAVGVHALLIAKSRGTGMTPVAHKAASGAAEVLPIIPVSNLARRIDWFKMRGIQIVGAASEAKYAWCDIDFALPTLLVIGSEGKGLRRLTREACDQLVSLPVTNGIDNLNLSVATGVLLYEVLRQRAYSA